ncbi:MAG: hypothetical protein COV47_00880 [Candidatus Diapherotrites archaeon CG11_big_fil_rev_8_21_14_0_20_37_9]|nr:MAG: hypothetical protein COV47_00880 [Candidatus Diapherotrites archaeon CG11_big_fil_rev_8_21_14_0_20_37_9]
MVFKDSKLLKFVIVLIFLQLILINGIIVSAYFILGAGVVTQVAAGTMEAQDFASGLLNIVFIIVAFPLILVYVFVWIYFTQKIIIRALELLGFKPTQYGIGKLLKSIVLSIWVSIAIMISWYNRKFMILFFAIIFLGLLSVVAAFLFPIASLFLFIIIALLFISYFFILVYNSVRLSLALEIFLNKDQGIEACTRESWDLTEGVVGNVFLAGFIPGIIIYLIEVVFGLVAIGLQLAGQLDQNLVLVGFLASTVFTIIYSGFTSAMYLMVSPSIYAQLSFQGNEKIKTEETPIHSDKITKRAFSPARREVQAGYASDASMATGTRENKIERAVQLLKPEADKFTDDEIRQAFAGKDLSPDMINEVIKRIRN